MTSTQSKQERTSSEIENVTKMPKVLADLTAEFAIEDNSFASRAAFAVVNQSSQEEGAMTLWAVPETECTFGGIRALGCSVDFPGLKWEDVCVPKNEGSLIVWESACSRYTFTVRSATVNIKDSHESITLEVNGDSLRSKSQALRDFILQLNIWYGWIRGTHLATNEAASDERALRRSMFQSLSTKRKHDDTAPVVE